MDLLPIQGVYGNLLASGVWSALARASRAIGHGPVPSEALHADALQLVDTR